MGLGRLWPYLRTNKHLMIYSMFLIPIISLFQALIPLSLRHAVDEGITQHNHQALLMWSAGFGVLVLLEYLTRAGQSITTSYAVFRMIRDLRMTLVKHILGLKAAYHDKTLSGTLSTRATSDFDNLSESLNMGVLTLAVDIAVLVGILIGMFTLSSQLAMIALVVLPVVLVIVQWFSAALKTTMLKARVRIATLNGYTQECLYGHTTIKLLTGEPAATAHYQKLNKDYRDAQMGSVVVDALMFSVLDGIASVTLGLALWYVVSPAESRTLLSAGILVAFVQYIQQLFDPLKNLGNKMAMLQGAFSSLDRIFGLLDQKDTIAGPVKLTKIAGPIVFSHVSFSYGPDKPQVLKDISFRLDSQQSLAIVGTTGSGKSTIIKLLSRLYDQYQGEITLDGYNLKELDPHSLRLHMSIVPQDIVLFDGTITFNISLGLPGVTQTDVENAARMVGAHEFISQLEGGYNHPIQERGANLSYGQKQLIAFARAMSRRPGLVILDEATSSIDPESEQMIQKATEAVLSRTTVIVIAHRLVTIEKCHQIMLLKSGSVVERGTHQELLELKKAYWSLYHGLSEGALEKSDQAIVPT